MRVLKFSNKIWVALTAIALVMALLPLSATGQEGTLGTNDSCLDPDFQSQLNTVHRRWHLGLLDHFYTNNPNEVGIGYQVESSGWGVIASQQTNTIPLYRFWSDSLTDHFYSTSAQAPSGYVSEGTVGYVFATSVPGSIPLHRLYRHIGGNPANGDHLYTIAEGERNDATTKHGYASEGIEAYVCAAPMTQ